MTVLIADDDRVLAQLLASRLKKAGFEIAHAFDAMQAIMLTAKLSPALVILDINMPGGTGFDVLKRLKSNVKTSLIPVLVLSGSVQPECRNQVFDCGADEFLLKPVNFDTLLSSVHRLLPSVSSAVVPKTATWEMTAGTVTLRPASV